MLAKNVITMSSVWVAVQIVQLVWLYKLMVENKIETLKWKYTRFRNLWMTKKKRKKTPIFPVSLRCGKLSSFSVFMWVSKPFFWTYLEFLLTPLVSFLQFISIAFVWHELLKKRFIVIVPFAQWRDRRHFSKINIEILFSNTHGSITLELGTKENWIVKVKR